MLFENLEREPALQPLSRDHGVLLVLVQRLRKAAEATVQDRVSLATEIASRHAVLIEQYLNDEQLVLANLNLSFLLSNEIGQQHKHINEGIKQLTSSSVESLQPKDFDALANIIENHVRWDERDVLPYLQKIMKDSEREALALHTSQVESNRDRPIKRLHHSIALNKLAGDAQTCTCADRL